jgi:type I restriction enzyme S subunit
VNRGADHPWESTTLGAVCEVNPSKPNLAGIPDDTPVLFVPMAAVDDVTGKVTSPEHRKLGEVSRASA